MNNEQALQIIQQALDIANSKGSFKLEESATILTALNTIKNAFEESRIGAISKVEKEKVRTVSEDK